MDLKSDAFCVLTFILAITEACLKKSEPETNSGSPASTTTPPSSHLPCTGAEIQSQRCLNGGKCFVTVSFEYRNTHCQCVNDYEGLRCEDRTGPLVGPQMAAFNTSAIVGIVIGIIVLVAILGIIAFFVMRKRRKNSRPKLEEPPYIAEVPDKKSRPSNYAAARHYHDSSQMSYSPGFTNVSFVGDISPHQNPPAYTISGSLSTPSRKSATIVGEPDEKDHPSSRPSSSTGGSLYYSSGVFGSVKTPLAFHETGV